jgi:hypothetical protein
MPKRSFPSLQNDVAQKAWTAPIVIVTSVAPAIRKACSPCQDNPTLTWGLGSSSGVHPVIQ